MDTSTFFPSASGPIAYLLFGLVLSAAQGWLLGRIYVACGTALSDRRTFAGTFVLLAMATTLIITVVKSSVALSLGLVGALSIVRFRAAIKDPEELTYLFLVIALGLGNGAELYATTLAAFCLMVLVIVGRARLGASSDPPPQGAYLVFVAVTTPEMVPGLVVERLRPFCRQVALNRFEVVGDRLELTLAVQMDGMTGLDGATAALRSLDGTARVSFVDRGVLD